jgi:hypothetical protein
MPPPIYELGSANNSLASYEAKLLAAKVLVTRREAETEIERTERTNNILFGYETVNSLAAKKTFNSKEGRSNFEDALSANSAFARLLSRTATTSDQNALLKDERFRNVFAGARVFTLEHAAWIHDGLKSDTYSIRDILRCEDMFLRSEVSTEEDMRVSHIGRVWQREGKQVLTETRAQVGLWKVSPGLYDWAHRIGDLLVAKRDEWGDPTIPRTDAANIYLQNREEVSDDPLIIEMLLERSRGGIPSDTLCIVTQDRKLCRSAAAKTGLTVFRVSTYAMPLLFKGEDMQSEICGLEGPQSQIGKLIQFPNSPRIIYTMVDGGSVFEMLTKHDVTDVGEGKKTYSQRNVRSYYDNKGKRHEVTAYTLTSTQETVGAATLHKMRDFNGHALFETFRPEKTLTSKLPKFESYSRGSSRSSRGSTSTTHSTPGKTRRPRASSYKIAS